MGGGTFMSRVIGISWTSISCGTELLLWCVAGMAGGSVAGSGRVMEGALSEPLVAEGEGFCGDGAAGAGLLEAADSGADTCGSAAGELWCKYCEA